MGEDKIDEVKTEELSWAVWDDDRTVAIGFETEVDARDYLNTLFIGRKKGDPDKAAWSHDDLVMDDGVDGGE